MEIFGSGVAQHQDREFLAAHVSLFPRHSTGAGVTATAPARSLVLSAEPTTPAVLSLMHGGDFSAGDLAVPIEFVFLQESIDLLVSNGLMDGERFICWLRFIAA